MAPVWVVLGSGILIGERVGGEVGGALLLCLTGAAGLIGTSYRLAPPYLDGDVYRVFTSFFLGLYFLAVRAARRRSGFGRILFLASLITAAVLLCVAWF